MIFPLLEVNSIFGAFLSDLSEPSFIPKSIAALIFIFFSALNFKTGAAAGLAVVIAEVIVIFPASEQLAQDVEIITSPVPSLVCISDALTVAPLAVGLKVFTVPLAVHAPFEVEPDTVIFPNPVCAYDV
jgi:hypothetical protein